MDSSPEHVPADDGRGRYARELEVAALQLRADEERADAEDSDEEYEEIALVGYERPVRVERRR